MQLQLLSPCLPLFSLLALPSYKEEREGGKGERKRGKGEGEREGGRKGKERGGREEERKKKKEERGGEEKAASRKTALLAPRSKCFTLNFIQYYAVMAI